MLFREGMSAEYVYIVKEGQFQIKKQAYVPR